MSNQKPQVLTPGNRKTTDQRGYSRKWKVAREAYLNEHPLCLECLKEKRVTAATVVDHIIPHKGDMKLFWDRNNWQPLCASHHNSDKQRFEKSKRVKGCDVNGLPIDPNHHWRKEGRKMA